MCDTFVALPDSTADHSVILAKSSDCETNEAQYIYKIAAQKHIPGEEFKTAHVVIPQAPETYEAIISRSYWTWGGELGINEHGLAVGNEAVFSTVKPDQDGLVVTDMLRLALERAKTAREAVEVIGSLVHQYGQGGNCELRGNSHFDGSYIFSDRNDAWILETAGKDWAARQIRSFDSISNVMTIHQNWDLCSLSNGSERLDFANKFQYEPLVQATGARVRQQSSYNLLKQSQNKVTVKTMFDILRHHNAGYHPGEGDTHLDICIHLGPFENRLWQATCALVTQVDQDSIISWWSGTSSNCLAIFKPIFFGVDLPDMGPWPNEHYDPRSLFWKHERLHRRAILDFDKLVPEIRNDFDPLEAAFIADAENVKRGTFQEKKKFMEHCFHEAMVVTERWIQKLESSSIVYPKTPFGQLWEKYNRAAAFPINPNH